MVQRRSSLEDLGSSSNINKSALEYVLNSLNETNELANGLAWRDEVWEGVTIEELIGALLGADLLLAEYNALMSEGRPTLEMGPKLNENIPKWRSEVLFLNFEDRGED